jgi:hypothetical protein
MSNRSVCIAVTKGNMRPLQLHGSHPPPDRRGIGGRKVRAPDWMSANCRAGQHYDCSSLRCACPHHKKKETEA